MKNNVFRLFLFLVLIFAISGSPVIGARADTPLDKTAVTVPTPVAPKGNDIDSTPTFKWTKVAGATQYKFFVYEGTSTSSLFSKTLTAADCGSTYCTYTMLNKLALGSYRWRVRAYVNGSWMLFSPFLKFAVVTTTPGTVSPGGKVTDNTPKFTWTKINSATQYRYQLYKGTTLVYTKTALPSSCAVTTCSQTPATVLGFNKYKWRVQAYIGGVWYPYSAFKNFSEAVELWATESDTGLVFLQSVATAYTTAHPEITFSVVPMSVDDLRDSFISASLSGNPPDLLLTVSDHVGQFVPKDLIKPVDTLFDMTKYIASEKYNGSTWGVPFSIGNHLMLLYNKTLVPTPPEDTYELRQIGISLTSGDTYGFAYNELEPFWLIPWLGGFGGEVFAADSVTPTLNTPEMINALQYLYDLKYSHQITPLENTYSSVDTLFKTGKVGMIINGDWSLADYRSVLGENLGVIPIPEVTATGLMPSPYTSGKYFMLPIDLSGANLSTVKNFVVFATNKENQITMVSELSRLPGLLDAYDIPVLQNDPILKQAALAVTYGTPMPTAPEMSCVWDAIRPALEGVLDNPPTENSTDAAAAAQAAAEACIAALATP